MGEQAAVHPIRKSGDSHWMCSEGTLGITAIFPIAIKVPMQHMQCKCHAAESTTTYPD